MKVFRIQPDFKFRSFYTWNPEEGDPDLDPEMLAIGGAPILTSWTPPKIYVHKPNLPTGNFAYLWSLNFAVDEHALRVLEPILCAGCEFLPLAPFEGQTFHLINVLDCIDCLEKDTSSKVTPNAARKPERKTAKGKIVSYSFDPRRIKSAGVFKIPEDPKGRELTATGLKTQLQDFKSVVERENLTGLVFEEIWSSEGPSIKTRDLLKKRLIGGAL